MSTPHSKTVDPELLPLLDGFPDIPINAETLPAFRAAMAEMAPMPDPADHAGVAISEITVPGPQGTGQLRCLLFQPAGQAPTGALLHIHGGGYVMGLPEMDVPRNIALVEAIGCVILSADYRLAPEHPHPAALEDCHAALEWLADQQGALGLAGKKIGVLGESAGGGLAASLALLARNRGTVDLACQVLIYPMLASPASEVAATASDPHIGKHIWPRDSNEFCWQALLGAAGGDAVMPPAEAADLSSLPPAFIGVGELDLFVHDNLAYASRLLALGNSVEGHLYPAAFHGFDRMDQAAVARQFTQDMVAFIGRMLA